MEKFIRFSAIIIIALGTLGFDYCICDTTAKNISKKLERWEKFEKETRYDIVVSAKRWLHVRELTGNNDHPWITKAMKLCGLNGNKGYAWCAASQTEIFEYADVLNPTSARVIDWFESNIIWERKWGVGVPKELILAGISYGIHNNRLNRYAHIGVSAYSDRNNVYGYEGNTSSKGQFDLDTYELIDEIGNVVIREGGGFYPKTRPWHTIDVFSDKCLKGNKFIERYDKYLQSVL